MGARREDRIQPCQRLILRVGIPAIYWFGLASLCARCYEMHVSLFPCVKFKTIPPREWENIKLPLSGRAGLLIHTRPTTRKLLQTLCNGDKLHMRQTNGGRIRAGGDFSGDNVGEDPQKNGRRAVRQAQTSFKNGDDIEFDNFTIGVRPDPEDEYPILGPTGLDGVTVAVMHSGVTNAALVGQLLTRQILHNISDPILSNFLLDRFSLDGNNN
ncbi:hypothetical protein HYQ46_009568 [Verticillium longisporum]|nr:hypothetical protein HYQ46_009568 [Verticillium longisporum]